jgi:hypothetical protein
MATSVEQNKHTQKRNIPTVERLQYQSHFTFDRRVMRATKESVKREKLVGFLILQEIPKP